jgi:RNA polymerase sigma-70 factor (ECF subfamily)
MDEGNPAPPELQLVEEIRRGDGSAEAALYEKFARRVYYLALSELRSREDAEDVRTETFLRVLQSIRQDRLRSPEALASFVLGTANNVIREFVRQRTRTEPLTDSTIESAADPHDSPFLDPIAQNTIEQVARRLKPREQAFLRMYYYEELSKEEIASRLGIDEDRVRLIKSRALKSFREIYDRLTKKVDTK